MPQGEAWCVWRVVLSPHRLAVYDDFRTRYTLDDVVRFNRILDALEAAERKAVRAYRERTQSHGAT